MKTQNYCVYTKGMYYVYVYNHSNNRRNMSSITTSEADFIPRELCTGEKPGFVQILANVFGYLITKE